MITLAEVKQDLRIDHTDDDALLTNLLNASISEAKSFTNSATLPTDDAVRSAVFLLIRSKYDTPAPDDMAKMRMVAEGLLMPHRVELGL